MTTPVGERFLSALAAQLESITTAGGYQTDAGARVLRAAQFVDDFPGVILWEGDEIVTDQTDGFSSAEITLQFQIDGFVEAAQTNTGTQLALIKADIKKCVMSWATSDTFTDAAATGANKRFGLVQYIGSTPAPRRDGTNEEGVSVRFSIKYPESVSNPY